jgi:SGNH domain (fused to AT3 domains)
VHLEGRRLALGVPAVLTLIACTAIVAPRAVADVSTATNTSVSTVTKTVMLVGDSVPKSLADEFADAAAQYGYVVVSAAAAGCPATGVPKVYSSGKRFRNNTCAKVVSEQNKVIDRDRPALVIWWSRYELAPRLGRDGKVVPLGSRAYWRAQQASFEERARALTKGGARLVTVQIEPPGRPLAARNPSEKSFLVGQTLLHRPGVVNAWNGFLASHKGPDVFSVSVAGLVCRDAKSPCYDTLPNGETARPDGVHYSEVAQRLLAPPIFDAVWRIARLESALTS